MAEGDSLAPSVVAGTAAPAVVVAAAAAASAWAAWGPLSNGPVGVVPRWAFGSSVAEGAAAFPFTLLAFSLVSLPLLPVSRASRLASGWSVGPSGEDGSSSGRFCDGVDVVGGESVIVSCRVLRRSRCGDLSAGSTHGTSRKFSRFK